MNNLYVLGNRLIVLGDVYMLLGIIIFTILVYKKNEPKTEVNMKDIFSFLALTVIGYILSLIPRIFIPQLNNKLSIFMDIAIPSCFVLIAILIFIQISFSMAGGLDSEDGRGWSFQKFLSVIITVLHIGVLVCIVTGIVVRYIIINPL